jgi:hypothetical protein
MLILDKVYRGIKAHTMFNELAVLTPIILMLLVYIYLFKYILIVSLFENLKVKTLYFKSASSYLKVPASCNLR